MCFVCFFKQKAAYEMRISDWSSDVCSSDLCGVPLPDLRAQASRRLRDVGHQDVRLFDHEHAVRPRRGQGSVGGVQEAQDGVLPLLFDRRFLPSRSEEHTSELQTLRRISYAVLCLTKRKYKNILYHISVY